MPWRATPDRVAAFERCTKFWTSNGYRVVRGDSDPKRPFNRSAARNAAVAKCDSSVVVVCDADTIPESIDQVRWAADVAADGAVVVPYDRYALLAATATTVADLVSVQPLRVYPVKSRPASLVVIGRDSYDKVGGFDEHFGAGWGYEDAAFVIACKTFVGHRTLPGMVYAFDHVAHRKRSRYNRHLHGWYQRAAGNPDQMRRLTGR